MYNLRKLEMLWGRGEDEDRFGLTSLQFFFSVGSCPLKFGLP